MIFDLSNAYFCLQSQEFQYSLTRIVKGIASSRDSAREGYFSVLSILLKYRTDLSISMLLDVLNKSLKIGNVSKGVSIFRVKK